MAFMPGRQPVALQVGWRRLPQRGGGARSGSCVASRVTGLKPAMRGRPCIDPEAGRRYFWPSHKLLLGPKIKFCDILGPKIDYAVN